MRRWNLVLSAYQEVDEIFPLPQQQILQAQPQYNQKVPEIMSTLEFKRKKLKQYSRLQHLNRSSTYIWSPNHQTWRNWCLSKFLMNNTTIFSTQLHSQYSKICSTKIQRIEDASFITKLKGYWWNKHLAHSQFIMGLNQPPYRILQITWINMIDNTTWLYTLLAV